MPIDSEVRQAEERMERAIEINHVFNMVMIVSFAAIAVGLLFIFRP